MHHEALTEDGKRLFPKVATFTDFYLAGGTALALEIGHRVSVDFDLFTGEKIKHTLLGRVEETFKTEKREILVNNANELTLLIDGVKVTFLSYPFPDLLPKADCAGLPVLSAKEIAATKAYTIGRRGELKDYIDLYFVLSGGHATLAEVMDLAEQKYGEAFDRRLLLEQLVYFDDIENVPIIFLGETVDRAELEKFFRMEVAKFAL